MGRLIDSEYLKEDMKRYGWEHVDSTVTEYVDGLDIVEAIPKEQYEARLKADLKAILVELQLEIDELYPKARKTYRDGLTSYCEGVDDSREIIQQKINALKGDQQQDEKIDTSKSDQGKVY